MGWAGVNNRFTIDTRGFDGNVIATNTFPLPTGDRGFDGWTQNKVFPTTTTKVKAAKRMRPVLKGQNYLQLRGKY